MTQGHVRGPFSCFFGKQKLDCDLGSTHKIQTAKDCAIVDVGGSYTLYMDDFQDRISDVTSEVMLIQESYPNTKSSKNIRTIDGFLAVSAYHLGRLSQIAETYERALRWAEEHHIELTGSAYERYVIDIYTSDDQDEYVTEILLPVECDSEEFNYLGQ